MEVPPLTVNTPDRKGIVGDIVLEAFHRSGYQVKIIVVPSPRAMQTVQQVDNLFIIPLARLPDREKRYTWIAPIMRVERAFFSVNKKVDSFDQARKSFKSIAVSRGTAGYNILLEHGFSKEQIVEVNQGVTAPKMLQAGHVDAWYNLVLESKILLKEVGGTPVLRGKAVGSTDQYLSCSKKCDSVVQAKLIETLKTMQADGTTKKIIARYVSDD
jgi:polar amino acid transport system substrate-binding protein